jgi:hypothetical protein
VYAIITLLNFSEKIMQLTKHFCVILVLRFLRLEFSVKLWLLGMSHIRCWKLSNITANIAFAIFRVNMLVGHFLEDFIGQAVGSEWDMMDLIGGAGAQTAIQLAMSTWLRKSVDQKFLLRGGATTFFS